MKLSPEIIFTYFPELSERQRQQIASLAPLYTEWNEKINVISRKDIDNLYVHHVLHSLSIAKFISFKPGTSVLDVGTGGGFPGIPLAILFPEVSFHLVDSIGKKIKVTTAISESLGLSNVSPRQARVEELNQQYEFVVSRAVTTLKECYQWTHSKISKTSKHTLKNGLLYLKGGDLREELKLLNRPYQIFSLSEVFPEEFFQTKFLIHIPG